MKDLAVLITVFNDQTGLDLVLGSIREPDNSFTLVIVDDGSEIRPKIDPEKYPFAIKLIELEQNQGTAIAANTGLDFIESEGFSYVARLDAADIQAENRLSIQYRYFQENPELTLLGSNAYYRSEETGEILFETSLPRTWEEIKKWNVFRTCFIHPTVMVCLDRLNETHRYSTVYPYIDDYVFLLGIAEHYPSEVLPDRLMDCFVREQGLSRKYEKPQLLSGIRHHLDHPKPLNPLWYAYIAKRLAYLIVPYRMRISLKGFFKMVKSPSPKGLVQA